MSSEQMANRTQFEGSITSIPNPRIFYQPPNSNNRVDMTVYQPNQTPLLVPKVSRSGNFLMGPGISGEDPFNSAAAVGHLKDAIGSTSARTATASNLGYGALHPSQPLVPRPISVPIPIAQSVRNAQISHWQSRLASYNIPVKVEEPVLTMEECAQMFNQAATSTQKVQVEDEVDERKSLKFVTTLFDEFEDRKREAAKYDEDLLILMADPFFMDWVGEYTGVDFEASAEHSVEENVPSHSRMPSSSDRMLGYLPSSP